MLNKKHETLYIKNNIEMFLNHYISYNFYKTYLSQAQLYHCHITNYPLIYVL